VINVVDVEKYLYGVVPYEIGPLDSARFEALKAQAVAARTMLIATIIVGNRFNLMSLPILEIKCIKGLKNQLH
jgi:SpoIID/LytB domain protein